MKNIKFDISNNSTKAVGRQQGVPKWKRDKLDNRLLDKSHIETLTTCKATGGGHFGGHLGYRTKPICKLGRKN